jgi:hypothetical protein
MDRSEIKKAYKLAGPQMGVYKITNTTTESIFLGRSGNLNAIMNRHRFELNTGTHSINELQEEWKKTGEKNIKFEIVDKLEPKDDPLYDYSEDLQELENLWIEKLRNDSVKVVRLKNTKIA